MITVTIDTTELLEMFNELTPRRFAIALNGAARELAQLAMKEFEGVVDTWENKPEFDLTYVLTPNQGEVEFEIDTTSDVFHWVDEGTKPHRIPKTGNVRLAFNREFMPKTSPNMLGSSGGEHGGELVFRTVVNQSIKPRLFSDTILDMVDSELEDTVFDYIQRAWIRQNS